MLNMDGKNSHFPTVSWASEKGRDLGRNTLEKREIAPLKKYNVAWRR